MVSHLGGVGWVPLTGPCPSGSQLTGSEHLEGGGWGAPWAPEARAALGARKLLQLY